MKASHLILGTQRENPSDAEIISHQLMIKAGLIRQVSSGIYNWLPIGKKVLQKVEDIIRKEMNEAGAQEILMPMVQPASLWESSGQSFPTRMQVEPLASKFPELQLHSSPYGLYLPLFEEPFFQWEASYRFLKKPV